MKKRLLLLVLLASLTVLIRDIDASSQSESPRQKLVSLVKKRDVLLQELEQSKKQLVPQKPVRFEFEIEPEILPLTRQIDDLAFRLNIPLKNVKEDMPLDQILAAISPQQIVKPTPQPSSAPPSLPQVTPQPPAAPPPLPHITMPQPSPDIHQPSPGITPPKLAIATIIALGTGIVGYKFLTQSDMERVTEVLKKYGKKKQDLSKNETALVVIMSRVSWMPQTVAKWFVRNQVSDIEIDDVPGWLWPILGELFYGKKATRKQLKKLQDLVDEGRAQRAAIQ